ncbi:MAG: hypothetical protein HY064_01910 [Bacteroidetes bacterium]|nr:hypothetical protein [Bacteroidota bacterium]
MTLPDLINTAGVSLILLAFLLLTIGKLRSTDKIYHLVNFCGAALACYGSVLIHAMPFVFLEAVWSIVAIYGLTRRTV